MKSDVVGLPVTGFVVGRFVGQEASFLVAQEGDDVVGFCIKLDADLSAKGLVSWLDMS